MKALIQTAVATNPTGLTNSTPSGYIHELTGNTNIPTPFTAILHNLYADLNTWSKILCRFVTPHCAAVRLRLLLYLTSKEVLCPDARYFQLNGVDHKNQQKPHTVTFANLTRKYTAVYGLLFHNFLRESFR